MNDYISRQAALDMVNHLTEIYVNNLPPMLNKADVYDNLRLLPTADVVKVVRCRDCKSFSHGYCKFHDAKFVREDGYCYWGERKDGEQND